MSEIPCTTLYNIFQHKNRVLNNQERAYQFLKQIFEGTKSGFHNEKSICILFETLDSTKIDEESLKESIEKRQERFGFAPIMNSSYFTAYRESFQNLMKLQQETLMIMKQQQELNAKKQNEMMIEIKTISQSIKTIENKIDKISMKNDQKLNTVETKIVDISKELNTLKVITENISRSNEENFDFINHIPEQLNGIENKIKESYKLSLFHYDPFRGIIHQLSEECNGNVVEKNVVDVTASTCLNGYEIKNIVDFNNDKEFWTENKENSFIKYDFKSKKIRPICYSIKSGKYQCGDAHPKNWVIEGSNTGSENDWTILDSRKNEGRVDGYIITGVFSMQKFNEFYRFIRVRQNGPDWSNKFYLGFKALEFYGEIQ